MTQENDHNNGTDGGGSSSPPFAALIDANVFFGPRLRDLFMHLHEAGVITVYWTPEIEDEWIRNAKAKQGAINLDRCAEGMHMAAENWEVKDYKQFEARFHEVDAKDRHVAAAAYKLSLDYVDEPVALVTKNVKDFPQSAFEDSNVTRYSVGGYLNRLCEVKLQEVLQVAESCLKKLYAPPKTKEEYLTILRNNDCRGLAEHLAKCWGLSLSKS